MDRTTNPVRLKDLNLAAYLYSEGIELTKVEREGSTCWFIFNDPLNISKQLTNSYWSGKAISNIKSFVDSLRTLKDLIFSTP